MATKEQIIEALKKLDPENSEHWTAQGIPVIKALDLEKVSRKEITDAAPKFSRENLELPSLDPVENEDEDDDLFGDDDGEETENEEVEKGKEELLKQALDEAEAELAEAQKKVDAARLAYEDEVSTKVSKGTTTQQDIMDYIKKQNQIRAEKNPTPLRNNVRKVRPLMSR